MMPDANDAAPSLGDAYAIERELGGGGMSRVFVAREKSLDRLVVVKVLSPHLAESLSAARFTREIRVAAALQEPHIVPLHAAGQTDDGLPFYTMPFVQGETLRARITRGAVPVDEALPILRDVARALDYAHTHGVVHRDIKPENVLLSSGTALVTDFGIAKAISAARDDGRRSAGIAGGSVLTSMGMSLGTPAYMSPEQAAGEADVDQRADIYSLGVVAWEMLAGRHPFADRTTAQRLIAAHISETPANLTNIPAPLARFVMRCLAKDPAQRPQSAREVIAALDDIPADTVARRQQYGVAVLAGIGVIAVLLGAMLFRRSATPARASAQSVGVATFKNLSSDPQDAYFSEGVTQEIANALGRVPGLRVAVYRPANGDATGDPRVLGKALNVDLLLQGTVQRAGNQVRIEAHLVNSKDGIQIWQSRFDRQSNDIFALQDDIARSVATELRGAVAPSGSDTLVRVTTKDPQAHNLYMQARYLFDHRGRENLYKSVTLYQQAIARDANFAQAWAGMGLSYAVLTTWDDVDVDAMLDKAESAAQKALAIDSTTADAWVALAESRRARWRSAESFPAFERAIALDPNNYTAHQWYGEGLAHVGRFDEGLAHIHRAQEIAPLNLPVNTQEGRIELQARHFEKAKQSLLHVLDIDSTYSTAHVLLGGVYLQFGQFDRAIDQFKRAVSVAASHSSLDLAFLAHGFAVAGKPDSAGKYLAQILQWQRDGIPVMHGGLAMIYSALGEKEKALAQLDTAVNKYDAIIEMHNHEAVFDPLRKDPRGAAMFARAER